MSQVATAGVSGEAFWMKWEMVDGKVIESPARRTTVSCSNSIVNSPETTFPTSKPSWWKKSVRSLARELGG